MMRRTIRFRRPDCEELIWEGPYGRRSQYHRMTATGIARVSHDRTSQMSSPTKAEIRPTVLRSAIASGAANTWRRLSRTRCDEPLMAILFRREAGFRPFQLCD